MTGPAVVCCPGLPQPIPTCQWVGRALPKMSQRWRPLRRMCRTVYPMWEEIARDRTAAGGDHRYRLGDPLGASAGGVGRPAVQRPLGARLVAFSRDGAVLHLPVRAELHQQHGFVHGGVLSYLVDNAITFAAGAVLGPDVVTGGFSIDYLRPATGSLLTAEARTVRAGAQQAVVRCEVMDHQDDESRLCAIGQGRVLRRATEG